MPPASQRKFVTELNAIDTRVSTGPAARHRHRYNALAPFERDLYDVNRFNFECVCGGLGVFFTNSAGSHWRETIAALARVGPRDAHRILVKACALFPGGEPAANSAQFAKQANDPDLQDRLDPLGDQIDDLQIMRAMEAYWKRHAHPASSRTNSTTPKPTQRRRLTRR